MLKYMLVLPQLWYNRAWPTRGEPAVPAELHTHDLVRLWERFDRDHPNHPLGQFADFVKWLNRWEDIRYAQYMDATPTVFATSMEAGDNAVKANASNAADIFVLDVPELDRFFRALMDFIGITTNLRGNRNWFGNGYDAYARPNPHVIA
jgi:hypothetical protein